MLPYHYLSFVQEYAGIALLLMICWLPPAVLMLIILRLLGVRRREKSAVLAVSCGALISPTTLVPVSILIHQYRYGMEIEMEIFYMLGIAWGVLLLSCGAYLLVMRWLRKRLNQKNKDLN